MPPIIRTYATDRIELARWGFWPDEWKRSKHSRAMINARLETAAEEQMFARNVDCSGSMIFPSKCRT
jgi:putative SOS response-associated peptidase YedK